MQRLTDPTLTAENERLYIDGIFTEAGTLFELVLNDAQAFFMLVAAKEKVYLPIATLAPCRRSGQTHLLLIAKPILGAAIRCGARAKKK